MARLRRSSDGAEVLLAHDALLGRSPEALVRLDSPRASTRHASLLWTDSGWRVRDLGSRNGTALNGEVVPPGEDRSLQPGDILELGEPAERWELLDTGAPVASACLLGSKELTILQDGYLVLPSPEAPELTVYEHPSLGWLVEREDGSLEGVAHGQVLASGGRAWRLHLATVRTTLSLDGRPRLLSEGTLRFRVSPDEETVDLSVVWPDEERALPESVHWYILLLLARARAEDAADPELPEREQGWVYRDELCRQLRTTPQKLNVDVHRMRRVLARASVLDGAGLVERRAPTAQLRLGTADFELG